METLPYGEPFPIMADGRKTIHFCQTSFNIHALLTFLIYTVNDARALRVVEIINDFRNLQLHISQLKSDAPRGQENEEGYVVMSQCVVEAQRLLTSQFNTDQRSKGNGEAEKVQLQRYAPEALRIHWDGGTHITLFDRIIVDASCRRFQAHKIYLKMAAARRWEMNRSQILQGQKPGPRHSGALAAIDQTLRTVSLAFQSSLTMTND